MSSIKRLGVLYGRLGLSTDADLIKRRSDGVSTSSEALELKDVPPLLRVAFRLNKAVESGEFLEPFGAEDPTFDVEVSDREASLLAAAILDHHVEQKTALSPTVALSIVTTAVGGTRRPEVHDGLVSNSEEMLARYQGKTLTIPEERNYRKQPDTLTSAIKSVGEVNTNYYNQASPHIVAALQEVGKFTEAVSLAAAKSDIEILGYIRGLERELHLYWWVSGGWSTEAAEPFRKLQTSEAAVHCGKELADKASKDIGLFSAPALIDMILERGRSSEELSKSPLKSYAIAGSQSWRRRVFSDVSTGPISDILAVSTALGLASDSGDADDWHPRFWRITSIPVEADFDPVALALQLYRERLVAKAFA